jgi:hypothetical protein
LFSEETNSMFSGLNNIVNRLVSADSSIGGPTGAAGHVRQGNDEHHSIETILAMMAKAEEYAQSASPAVASGGRAWLTRLAAQLQADHGIQTDG